MALNKREKMIAAAVGIAVLIWVGDSYVVEPFIAAQNELATKQAKVHDDLASANGVLANKAKVNDAWRALTVDTVDTRGNVKSPAPLKTTASAAESLTLHALNDWAEAARVNIESHKTDTPIQVGDFQQVRITVTGAGSMGGISRLIWDIETGVLPLQMGELRVQSRKDGTDDLGLQLTVTTLVYSPLPPAPAKKPAVPAGGAA